MPPHTLPTGQLSTVEYCRPDGVPLAMNLYMPPGAARSAHPAPVVLYMHGGGILGDQTLYGAGAALANHAGALFTPIQQGLNAAGFVVASVDFRLPPGAAWPAQIEDLKCAVRFLRAHSAGFECGQYPDQSSAVQAVADMFGAADMTDMADSSPLVRLIIQTWLGHSAAQRRAASPVTYVAPGAPPFLIIQGSEDPNVRPRQSRQLAERLRAVGSPATLIEVQCTGHTLDTPSEQPSPAELAARVVDVFTTTLR